MQTKIASAGRDRRRVRAVFRARADDRLRAGRRSARAQKTVYLRSSAALVQDAATSEVVIDKNADAVTPIASITKLMTAMVIIDRGLDLDARIVVSREDVRLRKGLALAARARPRS